MDIDSQTLLLTDVQVLANGVPLVVDSLGIEGQSLIITTTTEGTAPWIVSILQPQEIEFVGGGILQAPFTREAS